MPLSAGDKLGPYEILAPTGAGGMGEVWMLGVYAPDIHGVFAFPLKHVEHIGGWDTKL